jgi:hypothetical protein
MTFALLLGRHQAASAVVVCNDALARRAGSRDRPKLKIEAFETFGFQKWTLSTEMQDLYPGCEIPGHPET